jgi:alpha-galactosidase
MEGIPAEWNPSKTETQISSEITETTYIGKSPEGLSLRVVCRKYLNFPTVEYVAYFTNESDADTPMMENIRIEGTLAGKNATLWRGNGDTCNEEGFQWWSETLTAETKTIEPRPEGTSCKDAFPYLRLQTGNCGYNIAIGWSGYWTTDLCETENGIFLSVGQKRCHMVIRPGETMRTPSLVLMSYTGDEIDGANMWRRWYFAHIIPRENGELLSPKLCMHHMSIGELPEGCGMTEENQLAAIDGYLEKDIRPDVWWMDAGWYSCNYHWMTVGNWFPNPEGFPNGLEPVSEKCKKENRTVKQEAIKYQQALRSAPSSVVMASREVCVR